MTLHKLMTHAVLMPSGNYIYKFKKELDYKVIIVDECSMAPKYFVDKLLAFDNIYVLFCGDPFQIPPIDKDEDNHLLDKPHVFLDEIMRQSAESGIIRLSMLVRNHKDYSDFKADDVRILNKKELTTGVLNWGDINICSTNNTRRYVNQTLRALRDFPQDTVVPEDKLVCLRNYWDIQSIDGNALTNGTIGYVDNIRDSVITFPRSLSNATKVPIYYVNFKSETGHEFNNLELDQKNLLAGEFSIDALSRYKLLKSKKYNQFIPLEFDFGYAITGHRSQGSQWNKVCVIEESFPFSREEHARWLYTTITRAIDKLILVQK